jgi:hypothetical protein
MSLTRRGLLKGILAAGFAPAIGHAGILMPVKKIITLSDDIYVATDAWQKLEARGGPNGYRVYRNGILIGEHVYEPDKAIMIPVGGTHISFNMHPKNGQVMSVWAKPQKHSTLVHGLQLEKNHG